MKPIKKTSLLLVILLAFSASSTGCWDRIELEDIAWVQAMGFDAGIDGYLATTVQIGIPHSLRSSTVAGGGPGGDPEYLTVTVHSKTALEALDLISTNLGRRVSLEHTQLFLFGEDFARSGLRSLAGALDRYREVRGSALVAVAKGRAEDLLRINTSPLEVSPSRFIQTVLQQHIYTGLFKAATLARDFVNLTESSSVAPAVPLLGISADFEPPGNQSGTGGQGNQLESNPGEQYPSTPQLGERLEPGDVPPGLINPEGGATHGEGGVIPKTGGGPVSFLGLAVFRGDKMVGTLSAEEARAVLAVHGDLERASFAVPDPEKPDEVKYSLGFTVQSASSRVSVRRTGEDVELDVKVNLEVSYVSPKTQTDYTDPRMVYVAEGALASYFKTVLDGAIQKTQDMGADVFGFGRRVKMTFLTWPEFEAFEWPNRYKDARIATSVEVKVRRTGLVLGPLNVPRWEAEETK